MTETKIEPSTRIGEISRAIRILSKYEISIGSKLYALCEVFFEANEEAICKNVFSNISNKLLETKDYRTVVNQDTKNPLLMEIFDDCSEEIEEFRGRLGKDLKILTEKERNFNFDEWVLENLRNGLKVFMQKHLPDLITETTKKKQVEARRGSEEKKAVGLRKAKMDEFLVLREQLREIVENGKEGSEILSQLLSSMESGVDSPSCFKFVKQKSSKIHILAKNSPNFKVANEICAVVRVLNAKPAAVNANIRPCRIC